jgi:hypothetical protein
MKHLLLIAPLALAACNKAPSVDVRNASAEEVQAKVAASGASQALKPGRWEGQVEVTELQMPGMPPAAAAQMKSQMAKASKFASCLTPEEAKKPTAEFFGRKGNGCRYDRFTMHDGKIDAVMSCATPGAKAAAMTMTMNGTYAPDHFELAMTSKMAGGAGQPAGGMSMAMKMNSRNIGACKGDESS